VLGLQPEVHNTLSSMEQPDFSAMLMKMTGEPPAAEVAAHEQYNFNLTRTDSYDLGVMPELAFDFSLPFDSSCMSFDPPLKESDMHAWCHNVQSADAFTHNDFRLPDRVQ
jgi:hypothetical protein